MMRNYEKKIYVPDVLVVNSAENTGRVADIAEVEKRNFLNFKIVCFFNTSFLIVTQKKIVYKINLLRKFKKRYVSFNLNRSLLKI